MSTHTHTPDCTNCQSTQTQAVNYMNNEMLWAGIIVMAWNGTVWPNGQSWPAGTTGMTTVMKSMQYVVDQKMSANAFLVQCATAFPASLPQPNFPTDVQTLIVIDKPKTVHLVMPAFENIPPSSIDMVPHAL